MADQRFPTTFRDALWKTHNKKCFYCGELLHFRLLKVDHLIPESLLDKEAERQALFVRLGIDPAFDITSPANLVPSCEGCNTRKRDTLLPDGTLRIYIAAIRETIPKLDKALEQTHRAQDLDNTLRKIEHAVEGGKFSVEEIMRGLEELAPEEELAEKGDKLAQSAQDNTELNDSLDGIGGADRQIRVRILGFSAGFAPLQKNELPNLLPPGYSPDAITNNAQRLVGEGLIKDTGTHYLPNKQDERAVRICNQAMQQLLPEIIRIVEGQ